MGNKVASNEKKNKRIFDETKKIKRKRRRKKKRKEI
jgi:hypothetical protein